MLRWRTCAMILRPAALLLLACGLLVACASNNDPQTNGETPSSYERSGCGRPAEGSLCCCGGGHRISRRASFDRRSGPCGPGTGSAGTAHGIELASATAGRFQRARYRTRDASPFFVPPEDINVDDWVYSFDYELPEAEPGTELTVATALATNPLIPEYLLMRVVVTAPLLEDDTPFNVTLLLDPSGAAAHEEYTSAARMIASRLLAGLRPESRSGRHRLVP